MLIGTIPPKRRDFSSLGRKGRHKHEGGTVDAEPVVRFERGSEGVKEAVVEDVSQMSAARRTPDLPRRNNRLRQPNRSLRI